MTALSTERARVFEKWSKHDFTLASGQKAYKGGIACIDKSTGTVKCGAKSTSLRPIGYFSKSVDASLAAKTVPVDLRGEIYVEWFANDSATGATGSDVGNVCYLLDDQTVTMHSTGYSACGLIWAVTTAGVAVQVGAS